MPFFSYQPQENHVKVLLVEDLVENIEKAKAVLESDGHDFIIAVTLEEALFALSTATFDAMMTDLHFPEKEGAENGHPCGLAVVAECTRRAVPVAVVSDINHHNAAYAVRVIGTLATFHPKGSIPFVMDSKDFNRGLTLLKEVL